MMLKVAGRPRGSTMRPAVIPDEERRSPREDNPGSREGPRTHVGRILPGRGRGSDIPTQKVRETSVRC